ncbi:MAG: 16S rRNA (guanine(527)-N(7))-methyltransferase RsmG [Firmicutes bacterium]|nr:16S rRNA (guanine(527)-N(7))-methyltransferase RsmG [Bacillota bacterium]
MNTLFELAPVLTAGLARLGISVDRAVTEKLLLFAEAVLTENQRQNLTRITEPAAVVSRHLIDSLAVLPWVSRGRLRVCDVGTGAGFPGVPLAIVVPEFEVTLIDSEGKKVDFLKRAASELGLANVTALHLRAEEAGQDPSLRESFAIVVSRSVARLSILYEYTVPLLSIGGTLWAYKGETARTEAAEAEPALQILGGALIGCKDYQLPTGETHTLVQVEKIAPTPQRYPRRAGIPAKRPLC